MLQHKATQGKCGSLLPGWTDLLLLWIFMKFVSSAPQKRIRACSVPDTYVFFVLFVFVMKCINKISLKSAVGVTCRLVLMDRTFLLFVCRHENMKSRKSEKGGGGGNKKLRPFLIGNPPLFWSSTHMIQMRTIRQLMSTFNLKMASIWYLVIQYQNIFPSRRVLLRSLSLSDLIDPVWLYTLIIYSHKPLQPVSL